MLNTDFINSMCVTYDFVVSGEFLVCAASCGVRRCVFGILTYLVKGEVEVVEMVVLVML